MHRYHYEKLHGFDDGKIICGVDEVGRGPLAGPVVACAAILPCGGLPQEVALRIKDSKQLSAIKREALFPVLTELCRYGLGEASVAEIDEINILQASLLAMRRAVEGVSCTEFSLSAVCSSPLEGEVRLGGECLGRGFRNRRVSAKPPPPSPNPSLKGRGIDRACGRVRSQIDVALVDGNRAPELPCPVVTIVGGDGKCLSIAVASIIAKVTRDRLMKRLAEEHPGYGWEKNAGYGTAAHLKALRDLGVTRWHRRSFAPVGKMQRLTG
jgi:ribonuclease HII